MTKPKPKRLLSGAALSSHLKKEFKSIEDFERETLRLEKRLFWGRLARNPIVAVGLCFVSGIYLGALAGLAALLLRPNYINTATNLGFLAGISYAVIKRFNSDEDI